MPKKWGALLRGVDRCLLPGSGVAVSQERMHRGRVGDYAMPSGDGHWHYVDNALALPDLQRFADALDENGPKWAGLARCARQR